LTILFTEDESRTYEFLAGKEKVVEKPDFNGKLTKKVEFIVVLNMAQGLYNNKNPKSYIVILYDMFIK
jgi:hypothetical protein